MSALYTVRANLTMDTQHLPRGNLQASMVHHFRWPTDEDALADLESIVDHYTQSDIADRWTCSRGDTAHELILYRRSIESPNSWARLGAVAFQISPFSSITLPLPGTGEISTNVREAPLFRHSRGAVLVLEEGEDPTVHKRTYVGPLSPVALRGSLEAMGVEDVAVQWWWNPLTTDGPMGDSDSVDVWREEIAGVAVKHVRRLPADFEHGGEHVLIAWQRGIVTPVARRRASKTRAELLTRSVKGGFTDWNSQGPESED